MTHTTSNRSANAFRQLWRLMTKDVSAASLEKFIREEIPGAYAFFRKNLKEEQLPAGSVRRFLRVAWLLFLLFLEKLTPMRRLLFAVALALFFFGGGDKTTQLTAFAFFLVVLVLVLEVADTLLTKSELVIAREIQLSLLPSELLVPKGFEAAASSEVANSVGGDYYDTIALRNGSVLYALADVSGKGISAALYTTTVQTALRIFAEDSDDPSTLLERIDDHMKGKMRRQYFLTMVLASIDPKGMVRIARAGHPHPIHVSRRKKMAVSVEVSGVAIGMGGVPAPDARKSARRSFGVGKCRMEPGDLLVCVSDGVLETANPHGEEYGEQRLKALLQTFSEGPVGSVRDRIMADLRDFRRGHDLRDDSTFIIVGRTA